MLTNNIETWAPISAAVGESEWDFRKKYNASKDLIQYMPRTLLGVTPEDFKMRKVVCIKSQTLKLIPVAFWGLEMAKVMNDLEFKVASNKHPITNEDYLTAEAVGQVRDVEFATISDSKIVLERWDILSEKHSTFGSVLRGNLYFDMVDKDTNVINPNGLQYKTSWRWRN